ncbi:hypothetical protein LCGC14_0910260 [marine sediment metagenome]|uniref:Uncharacterized protein n=1 Tax=marine sediment metagenome TaxID=412755 RepID=A0A0F9RCR8_9ZZZZ
MFKKKKKKACVLKNKIITKIEELKENREKGLKQLDILKKKEKDLTYNILKINGALVTLSDLIKDKDSTKENKE